MKYLLLLLTIASLPLNAQNSLNFTKRSVECEDKWIAYQMDKDSLYTFGFIYIDEQAGLTFNYEGEFKITKNGAFVPSRKIDAGLKSRLQPNRVAIALIPEDKFSDLHISKTPEWLKYYKGNENSVARLYKWGFMYNGWDECGKALEYLERAKKLNPDYQGLKVELAYSYNCLKRYNDAVEILKEALIIEPKDAYINKELIFAEVKLDQIDQAEKSFRKALELCEEKTYNAENAFQVVQGYFIKKDIKNFDRFLNETNALLATDGRFPPIIEKMKVEIKQ
jgi:tetratricopeptide (TPR) repeat protein